MSFFAFQDIITAVSGILILIVIFLILMLQRPGLLPIPIDLANDLTLGELDDLIAEATEKLRKFEWLKLEAAGATEAELRAEIAELEASLSSDENPEGKEIREELAAVEKEVEEVKKENSKKQEKRDMLAGEVEVLRGEVESKANDLAEAEESSQIWLHAGTSTRRPIIIEVDEEAGILRDFDDPDKKDEMTLAQFATFVKQQDSTSSYFVFFVRPKGVLAFKVLRQLAVAEGFGVGYNAIGDDTDIMILAAGG